MDAKGAISYQKKAFAGGMGPYLLSMLPIHVQKLPLRAAQTFPHRQIALLVRNGNHLDRRPQGGPIRPKKELLRPKEDPFRPKRALSGR